MYTQIIIFYASLLGIILMILLKRRELNTGNKSLVSRIGAGSDALFNSVFSHTKSFFSLLNRRTLIVLTQWLAYHTLLPIRKIYVEIKHQALLNPHSKKVIDAVRGRGQIQQHGASFYLRRISTER